MLGSLKIAQALLAACAYAEAAGKYAKTAVHFASETGPLRIVQELLAVGADAESTDKYAKTASHFASAKLFRVRAGCWRSACRYTKCMRAPVFPRILSALTTS